MSKTLPAPAAYVPYHDIGDEPHIVVDGKDKDSTLLTLSHWPWNRTPESLRRDTSTHIALAYLEDEAAHLEAGIVSNSHYDEDGLLSMFALTNPELAWQHRDLLIRTSYASDFWRCEDEDAAKLSFVLAAWTDPETSPLPADIYERPLRQKIIAEYSQMLEALPGILEDPYKDESFWIDEFMFWQDSIELIKSGQVTLEEDEALDLVVVRVPGDVPLRHVRRYLENWQLPVHPFAVTARSNRSRIVWLHGNSFSFQYRYESWVQVVSFRPLPRVDLAPLAEELTKVDSAEWVFDGVHEVIGGLYVKEQTGAHGQSTLSPDDCLQRLRDFLCTAPVAWDPYGDPPEDTSTGKGDE